MFKARGDLQDGRPAIIIGLEAGNVERLKQGKPIAFDLKELGLVGMVMIVYGETKETIYAELVAAGVGAGVDLLKGTPPESSILPQKRN